MKAHFRQEPIFKYVLCTVIPVPCVGHSLFTVAVLLEEDSPCLIRPAVLESCFFALIPHFSASIAFYLRASSNKTGFAEASV